MQEPWGGVCLPNRQVQACEPLFGNERWLRCMLQRLLVLMLDQLSLTLGYPGEHGSAGSSYMLAQDAVRTASAATSTIEAQHEGEQRVKTSHLVLERKDELHVN
jgi:hypothetical protein